MSGIMSAVSSASNVVSGISGTATGISKLSGALGDVLSGNYAAALSGLGPWANGMQVASWRGLQFAVRQSTIRKGRRFAEHVYPYRDAIWEEDIGRGIRRYSFQAFLVGDNVLAQSAAMQAAVETVGTGTLVHPTLGSLTCAVTEFVAQQNAERGRVIDLNFTFTESAAPLTPALVNSTQKGVLAQITSTLSAIATDFQSDIVAPLEEGAAVVESAVSTVFMWTNIAESLVGDASLIFNSVSGLVGNNGIYSSGGLTVQQPLTATASSLLAASTTNRTALQGAVVEAGAQASSMTSASTSSFAAAVASVPAALVAAAVSPDDQIRLLMSLSVFSPPAIVTTAPIGAAMAQVQTAVASLARRSAITSLALACSNFQPSSSQAALELVVEVTELLDAEITIAADVGDLLSYSALRALRAAVSQDLISRAAQLPSQITITTNAPQPSLQIAYRLYRDASRSDDLIARTDPINPAFMPVSFVALSA